MVSWSLVSRALVKGNKDSGYKTVRPQFPVVGEILNAIKGKGIGVDRDYPTNQTDFHTVTNDGRPEKHSWLLKVFTATFSPPSLFCSVLFSTISGILESCCRLFKDGILTLQWKRESL